MTEESVRYYLDYEDLDQYDWDVDVDPEVPKADDEYDIVVIGSGIGGLCCASLLSKKGYKVLVLEHHYQVGGYYGSFSRKGFLFNTGAVEITGLWDKGPIHLFLQQLGLDKEDFFDRSSYKYIFEDISFEWSDSVEELIRQLVRLYPEEKKNIDAFFGNARLAHEERFHEAHLYGVPLPPSLRVKLFGKENLLNHLKQAPHSYDWMSKTVQQKLDEYFQQEEIKIILDSLLSHFSGMPGIPADVVLRNYAFYRYGSFFPKGGAQKLSNAIKDYIEQHGGKVLLKCKAEKILMEKGKVTAVRSGNRVFKCSAVVSNSNAKTTFLDLVQRDDLDEKFVEYIKGIKMTESGFMVCLGLDMDLSDYPTLISGVDFNSGEGIHVVFNSNADASYAPNGQTSVTLFDILPSYDFPERGTNAYKSKKAACAERLIQKAEKLIPGLSEHIVVKDAATPKTFERYTLMPEGAFEAEDGSIDAKRPCFKTPVQGLYLAGASTYPGSGVELSLMSGIICANDIDGWKRW